MADREAPIPGWLEGDGEAEAEDEVFVTPAERMEEVKKRIQKLENEGNYGELIKAWVEYGACVRILHSDKDKQLVQAHFNLATNYLRQKLVMQALYHFKEADTVNQAHTADDDALFFKCRIMEGMGICETRLEHFKAAEGLLEQAKRLCMKKALGGKGMDEAALIKHIEEVDVEEIEDTDGAVASVSAGKEGERESERGGEGERGTEREGAGEICSEGEILFFGGGDTNTDRLRLSRGDTAI